MLGLIALIGVAAAAFFALDRPGLDPRLGETRVLWRPDTPLYALIDRSEPLRAVLTARLRRPSETDTPPSYQDRAALAAAALDRLSAARRGPAPAPTEALALGPNGIYAPALAAAAAQSGLSAGAIAALIDAEAAKTSDGRWDPKSDNPASTARGLAQFLEGTWLDQAAHPARSLHRRAREAGLIAEDGSVLDRAALLALRDTPDLAILAAAEMAADNLLALARLGYAPVDDQAAARLAYLAHHEGLAGAHAHLTGATTAARAARRLTANLADEGRVAQLVAAHGGAHHEAYAAWLEGYIEARIEPDRFRSVVN